MTAAHPAQERSAHRAENTGPVGLQLDLSGDFHVHSTYSDDAVSTLQENVLAARAAGLRTLQLVDHVRVSTTWVPDFLSEFATLDGGEVTLLAGVETKILDATGRLDLPDGLPIGPGGLARVLIADHQFPGPDGPWSPTVARQRIAEGMAPADMVDLLITASIRAIAGVSAAQLAHPFSILPKIGLSEDDLHHDHLVALGSAAAQAGCLIEVNEKWRCPGGRALTILAATGATFVASTDSHVCTDIGKYAVVGRLVAGAGGTG